MTQRNKALQNPFIFLLFYLLSIFSCLSYSRTLFACTDFRILAKDNSLIMARSIEYSENLNSTIKTVQRNATFNSVTPSGKPGMSWQTKFGYVAIDAFNAPLTLDGMNEKGLSFEYLFLPDETQYQDVPAGKESQALPYHIFGDWILGNFDSVPAIKDALSNMIVFSQQITALGTRIFPLHACITDIQGNSIIVEFVGGKINVYDNQLGVVTNSPSYDWHLINLRNFMDLSPYSLNPVTIDGGLMFIAATQSAGLIGLPGDYSSPSRFVRTAIESATANPADNALQALNIAQHLMNSVDVTNGIVRAKASGGAENAEWTQWVVFKDITNKILYYRTYEDLAIRSITLSKLNFSEKANALKMILNKPIAIIDTTDQFISGKGAAPAKISPAQIPPTVSPGKVPTAEPAQTKTITPAKTVTVTPVIPANTITVTPAPPVTPVVPVTPVTPTIPVTPAVPVTPPPKSVTVSPAIPVITTPAESTTEITPITVPPPPAGSKTVITPRTPANPAVPVVVVPGSSS